MTIFKNEIVKPYWKKTIKFTNAFKDFQREIFIIPTIAIVPFEKQIRNKKRYGDDRWEIIFQIVIMFAIWELSFSFSKKNYEYL